MRHAGLKCAAAVSAVFATTAQAQDSNADLAKKLSNPIASLISVPFQFNYDHGYGPDDGNKTTVNIQPVIPFSLNADWNVISRTILPVTSQNDIAGPRLAVRSWRHAAELLLFACQAHRKRHHLGCGSGLPDPDRDRRPARW